MKIKLSTSSLVRQKLAGFSLIEATIGLGIIGTVVGAMLSGIANGTFTMRMARENLRATQIMLEKVETIRLYSWDQINSNGFIPTTFTNLYDPQGAPNASCGFFFGPIRTDRQIRQDPAPEAARAQGRGYGIGRLKDPEIQVAQSRRDGDRSAYRSHEAAEENCADPPAQEELLAGLKELDGCDLYRRGGQQGEAG